MSNRFDYSHAIATAYRGYEFRSRLEAKYAHWFDLCGWQWSYEPLDLPGWIPDFALGERRTLVEIKPAWDIKDFADAISKIQAAGYQGDVILLGADPTACGRIDGGPCVGWISIGGTDTDGTFYREEWDLHFGITDANGKLGLCPMGAGWVNAVWKESGKPARVWLDGKDVQEVLVERWAKACNVAKWIPIKEST